MSQNFSVLIVLFITFVINESARILGIVPTPSFSHQTVFRPLWRELAKRGHQVVVITTDPEDVPTPNVTQIDLHSIYRPWRDDWKFVETYDEIQSNPYRLANMIRDTFLKTYDWELAHPEVEKLIKDESQSFDLVLNEAIHPLMFALAYRFGCPYIGISSMQIVDLVHLYVGSPIHPVAYPDALLPFEAGKMNFWERVASTLVFLFLNVNMLLSGEREETALLEKHFGKGVPKMTEMLSDVSMVFVNSHPVFKNRPLGSNVINIGGGLHIEPPKPLPKDLKSILDASERGVVYLSLGTNVLSKNLARSTITLFVDTFKEMPSYDFLWKFDVDVPDLPSNVKVSKWFPQRDVLNHPKVRAFITQGGLQSTEEAIFSHVPMVMIPFIYDQITNARFCVKNGLGVLLDRDGLTKEALKEAILEVIGNPKYKNRAESMSDLLADQPMTGLDRAVWWTEYVLRHKGAKHLRSTMLELPFYQAYLLDVIGFLIVTPLVVLYLISKIIQKFWLKK